MDAKGLDETVRVSLGRSLIFFFLSHTVSPFISHKISPSLLSFAIISPFLILSTQFLIHTRTRTPSLSPFLYFFLSLSPSLHQTLMNSHKLSNMTDDLRREAKRRGIPFLFNPLHPLDTHPALLLLLSISDNKMRGVVTSSLFDLYWSKGGDVTSRDTLRKVMHQCGVNGSLDDILCDPNLAAQLRENTSFASSRGVFSVPSFFLIQRDEKGADVVLDDRFYFSFDRLFLLGRRLGLPRSHPLGSPFRSVVTPLVSNPNAPLHTLYFYFDFGSPWAYIASSQVQRIASEHSSRLVYRPILLGALFKMIGTPNVPMLAISDAKRQYGVRDMNDWLEWWGGTNLRESFSFPTAFPLRTVTPLRLCLHIQAYQPNMVGKVVDEIFEAAWQRNVNIGSDEELVRILLRAGMSQNEAMSLIDSSKRDDRCKAALRENTQELADRKGCGVPSFSVDNGPLLWGQDRLGVVEDMLSGWKDSESSVTPKL